MELTDFLRVQGAQDSEILGISVIDMGFLFCHGIFAKSGIVMGFFSFYDKNFFNAAYFVKYLR